VEFGTANGADFTAWTLWVWLVVEATARC